MNFIKKHTTELIVACIHALFSIFHILHEVISGDLDDIISLNGLLELGSTTTGSIIIIITIIKYIFNR